MSLYILIQIIGVIKIAATVTVAPLSQVNSECIAENTEPLSNDFLLGTWYRLYYFTYSKLPDSDFCGTINFTRASPEEMQLYKDKFRDADLPFSFDDNPVLIQYERLAGAIIGSTRAKFFVISPRERGTVINDGYTVSSYRPIRNKYILHSECRMRGNIMWLYSRDTNLSLDDVKKIKNCVPAIRRFAVQRYCFSGPLFDESQCEGVL